MPAQSQLFPSLPPPAPPPSTLALPPPELPPRPQAHDVSVVIRGDDPPPPLLSIQDLIRREAEKAGVPPELALAVAEQESSFNPHAINPQAVAGGQHAIGTFQLLPETAKTFGVDPNDPHENIVGGVKYLKQLMDRYQGDPSKALKAYGGVVRDTTYVPQVLARMQKYMGQTGAAAAAPPDTFWTRHPILGALADSFDPHERQGRQNLAGGIMAIVGGVGGAALGAAGGGAGGTVLEPGGGTLVGGGAGGLWGGRIGSVAGAAAGGALEQALIEETPIGDWLSKHLPWGTQDEPTPPPDPTSTLSGRMAGAAVNQGLSDVVGQAIMKPVGVLAKRALQFPIAKAALEKLQGIHADALAKFNQLKLGLTQSIRGAEQAGTDESAALAADIAARRANLSQVLKVTQIRPAKAGVEAARDLASHNLAELKASHDALIAGARTRAAAAVGGAEGEREAALAGERAAHEAMLQGAAPSASAAGKSVADVFEGAAQVPRRTLGAAVDEAAASGPFKDIRPLKAEAARIEQELPRTFPNQKAAAVVEAIKNESPIVSFQRLHELKKELQDSLSGVYDKASRKQMEGAVMHLTKLIRETLSGYAPYDLATKAYADVVPRYSSQLAKTIRRSARTSPEDIAQMISADKPTQARFLKELMTEAATEGGDAAGGKQALENVQDVWFYKNVLEGDLTTLGDRLATLKRNPEFLKNFLGDERMTTLIQRAEDLAQSYPELDALHQARIAAAKGTGETEVAAARTAKAQALRSHRLASTADIRKATEAVTAATDKSRAIATTAHAGHKAEQVRLDRQHADLIEELRQAKETATSPRLDAVTEALTRLEKSTLGSKNLRSPVQVGADLLGAMRPASVFSGMSTMRLLLGASDADIARFVIHSKLPVRALTRMFITGRELPMLASHAVKATQILQPPPKR